MTGLPSLPAADDTSLRVFQASALLEDGDEDEESAADLADQISGSGSGAGGT